MKFVKLLVIGVLALAAAPLLPVKAAKKISASQIFERIVARESINYENVTVYGDLDLSRLPRQTNDAVYPENGRTVRVYSGRVNQEVTFKNVTFTGTVDLFRKVSLGDGEREYRVVFTEDVSFENCRFRKKVDFELTNFDAAVSFENSTFDRRPSFVRVGLVREPNFAGTLFKRGSRFKNFQDDETENLTAAKLQSFYQDYLKAVE